ncbi:MAG: secondary thiamine-phosphate synthase enzyme YjbQ [Cyclobacteriaceae bacterium]|nr:secondary thiamine-phosphate synthase enzyme YjbQ [Cyclobacteriaceae bacterium]
MSLYFQKHLRLPSYPQGYHLITDQVVRSIPEIKELQIGLLQVFIQHTSAGLCINENADPTVRKDFQTFVNDLIPESYPRFVHDYEGTDDMPAHLKSAFLGCSVQIPISGGKLALGIWQGIYLCEFRYQGGPRNLVLTAFGSK